jgi:REP element-mobilizing transposase RayT
MAVEQRLHDETKESKKWLDRETEATTYKRDLQKRIELINWVLENMKNPYVPICNQIESRMGEIVLAIDQTHSIIESDKLHSELRILNWILYQVCVNKK